MRQGGRQVIPRSASPGHVRDWNAPLVARPGDGDLKPHLTGVETALDPLQLSGVIRFAGARRAFRVW